MKKNNRTRPIRVWFRVKENEERQLQENMKKAGIQNREFYCRQMVLNGYIIKKDYSAIKDLVFELNKIGTNINQIAKHANAYGNLYQEDMENLKKGMKEIWQRLGTVL